jgi:hypothetical protein
MKNLIFIFIALFAFTAHAGAQTTNRVVLCESYDTNGAPTGINKNWDISKNGSYVYVLYSQESFIPNGLLLYIDKKNDKGEFVAYDTKDFPYNPKTDKQKFAVYDCLFSEIGDYKLNVIDAVSKKVLASTTTNIALMKEEKSGTTTTDETDTYYYENSFIVFGESIDDNAVVSGEATTFKLIGGKRDLYLKLEQDDDLKLTELVMDVYGGEDYKELSYTETFNIPSKDWNWVKLPVKFTKTGKYVVDLYTQDDVYVNSGYIEITQ